MAIKTDKNSPFLQREWEKQTIVGKTNSFVN